VYPAERRECGAAGSGGGRRAGRFWRKVAAAEGARVREAGRRQEAQAQANGSGGSAAGGRGSGGSEILPTPRQVTGR